MSTMTTAVICIWSSCYVPAFTLLMLISTLQSLCFWIFLAFLKKDFIIPSPTSQMRKSRLGESNSFPEPRSHQNLNPSFYDSSSNLSIALLCHHNILVGCPVLAQGTYVFSPIFLPSVAPSLLMELYNFQCLRVWIPTSQFFQLHVPLAISSSPHEFNIKMCISPAG